jgi:uncharacterized Rmd1/YagE family protein
MASESSNQTIITVVSSDATTWLVRAICFDMDFEMEVILSALPDAKVLYESPLVVEFKGTFASFFSFGVLVYWAGNEENLVEMMLRIEKKFGTKPIRVSGQNELSVSVNHPEEAVSFREVQLQSLSVEHIKVVSETLGQSLALNRCQSSVHELFSQCRPLVQELQSKGNIHLANREILKLVGRILSLREETLSKLALIDAPLEAWQSERFTRLHSQLYDRFNVKQRLATLETKLDYLLSLNETLMNLIRHQESHRLEWIIILLIVIEVIYSTIHFFIPPM